MNIGGGERFAADFLRFSPNNRIPAMVGNDPGDGGAPLGVFESGAILEYPADKTGRFLPASRRTRSGVLRWLYWQVGGLGPMLGQNHAFNRYAPEKIPYATDRYVDAPRRLCGVLDKRLADRDFVAGEDYRIADMAAYPWIVPYQAQGMELAGFPYLAACFARTDAACLRAGRHIGGKANVISDEEARRHLFGQGARAG